MPVKSRVDHEIIVWLKLDGARLLFPAKGVTLNLPMGTIKMKGVTSSVVEQS